MQRTRLIASSSPSKDASFRDQRMSVLRGMPLDKGPPSALWIALAHRACSGDRVPHCCDGTWPWRLRQWTKVHLPAVGQTTRIGAMTPRLPYFEGGNMRTLAFV